NDQFLVECDVKTQGGDWLLIQRRQDGSVDFFRNWTEYQKGFGKIDGEFFIGLDKLHALTNNNGPQELLIVLEDKNETRHAKYSHFVVGNESEFYALQHLGVYSGDAGDSLNFHLGYKFSTKDQDNDNRDELNCAEFYTGAWWYNNCHQSNLNGKYGDTTHAKGITWYTFRQFNFSVEHLHALTNYNGPQELLIILEDQNELRHAKYSHFVIGSESEFYALQHLGVYTGNAGDSLRYHLKSKFSTKDNDNDNHESSNCATDYTGAWWYNKCHHSNLNGKYGDKTHAKGITWQTFRNYNVSVEYVKMMIRRRTF
ncbi:hypothetical protein FF38_06947, partial [Lucilia cuprina]